MNEAPETRDSLLLRLTDAADQEAWCQFASIYRPLIYRVARGHGLQDADAVDLVQRVLLSVSRAIEQWLANPQRAKFRTWLHTVAKHAVIDQLRSARLDVAAGGTTAQLRLQDAVDGRNTEDEFDLEYQRELFRWAARLVRDEFEETTWHAFWRTAVEGDAIPVVAEELQKTVGAVYVARSRVMQRLRDKVKEFESDIDDPCLD